MPIDAFVVAWQDLIASSLQRLKLKNVPERLLLIELIESQDHLNAFVAFLLILIQTKNGRTDARLKRTDQHKFVK